MIQVFVGCAANHEDAESQLVLEHSLRSRCSEEVSITWMKLSKDPTSPFYSDGARGWQTKLWATPFSGFRWAVPALMGHQGRAVYMDSDVIVRADLAELHSQAMRSGAVVLAKGGDESWRYCVSLWDCAAARPHVPPIRLLQSNALAHRTMINKFKTDRRLVQPFAGNWNCIDGEDYADVRDPRIKILHYSSEAHQPQLRLAVPRLALLGRSHWFDGKIRPHWRQDVIDLFNEELDAALAAGMSVETYTQDPLFGNYVKATQKNYTSNKWGRQHA